MPTKVILQSKIEQLEAENAALQKQAESLKWDLEYEKGRLIKLIAQDNSLLHLLDEILGLKVQSLPLGDRDAPIIWGFFDRETGQELHRDESLSEGFKAVWQLRMGLQTQV